MDPAITALAANIITVLAPFVAKSAEEFASKVGEATYEKAKAILTTLKQKWSKDEEATATLALFEKKPERHQGALEEILEEKLSQDEDLKAELSRLIQDMGPTIIVLQKMDDAEDVTGATFNKVNRGSIQHTQDFKKGRNVKGPEFGEVG